MKCREFVYWLQGYFELLNDSDGQLPILNTKQVQIIKNHLHMVFVHEIDPESGNKKVQDVLNAIHTNSGISGGIPSNNSPNKDILIRC